MDELTLLSDDELKRATFDARFAYAMTTRDPDAILALLDEIEAMRRKLMDAERVFVDAPNEGRKEQ